MNAQVQNIVHSHNTLWVCCLARESANRPTHSQGFFQLIREMGSVTPNSEKMGNARPTPYANKKWVACSDNKSF